MKMPNRLHEGMEKIIDELGRLLDVEMKVDDAGLESGVGTPSKLIDEPVWLCKTKRAKDEVPVGFSLPHRAVVHFGKTLLLIPYRGPTEDIEIEEEVLEAFKEVFNVFVGTWNRVVTESSRMQSQFEPDSMQSMDGPDFRSWLEEQQYEVWTFPIKAGKYDHYMSLWGPAEWLGFGEDVAEVTAPEVKAEVKSAAKKRPTKASAVKAPAAASEAPSASGAAPGVASPERAAPAAVAPESADEPATDAASSADTFGDEWGDDAEDIVAAAPPAEPVQPHKLGAGPGFDSSPEESALRGRAASDPRAGATARDAAGAGPRGDAIVFVDETGALSDWLALQLRRGRLKAMRSSARPEEIPAGASVVMVNPAAATVSSLAYERMYVIRPG